MAQQVAQIEEHKPCPLPPLSAVVNDPNIFNAQQEEWLGEILDQQLTKQYRIIEDPDGHLRQTGERLLAQLPPAKVHYQFFIIDLPILNSFSSASGHIYVSRKLISFAKNEDELAGVLGHEIGHIVTHQFAIHNTYLFRKVLGITQVGDKQDIFNKWNLLLDNIARKPAVLGGGRKQNDELIADRIGLYAMARAGYQASGTAEIFDRVAQTKGNTGNFFTDIFGVTSEDSKRLREMIRNSTPLPRDCVASLPAESAVNFTKWQRAVTEAHAVVAKEELPGLIRKVSLQPALRADLDHIRFSPDGKYLLAQDESSIFVLSRDPLLNLFRIDAPEARAAQFTPDSKFIVFYDKELRVEQWNVASQQRTAVHIVAVPGGCWGTKLSPAGDVLACTTREFEVRLIDVNSGTAFFARKNFYEPDYAERWMLQLLSMLGQSFEFPMNFSPDGHYFVIGRRGAALGYDLRTHSEIKLAGRVKELASFSFTFLGADRIAGFNPDNPAKSGVVRFPTGEVLNELALRNTELAAATKGDFLLIRPVGEYGVGILDLNAKTLTGHKRGALDIYDRFIAVEELGGDLGIFSQGNKKATASIQLPHSQLGILQTFGFSPDGNWLAISGRSRGAVWDLRSGERILYTRAFDGNYFEANHLIAKFRKSGEYPSQVVELDPLGKADHLLYEITSEEPAYQSGDLLITFHSDNKDPTSIHSIKMQVRDVRSNEVLWERRFFKSLPRFSYSQVSNTLTLLFTDPESMKAQAKADPAVERRLHAIKDKKSSYLVEVVDARSGSNLGAVAIDTGKLSFRVYEAIAEADTVVVADSDNRLLFYSLRSGEQKGKIFGHIRALSKNGEKLLVEGDPGQLDIYDVATLNSLAHYVLPAHIAAAAFDAKADSISILTADQAVYSLKLSVPEQVSSVH